MGTYNVGWEDGTTQVFAARDDEDARLHIQRTVIEMERDDPPGPWSDVRFLRDADSARDVPDPLAQIRGLLGRHAKQALHHLDHYNADASQLDRDQLLALSTQHQAAVDAFPTAEALALAHSVHERADAWNQREWASNDTVMLRNQRDALPRRDRAGRRDLQAQIARREAAGADAQRTLDSLDAREQRLRKTGRHPEQWLEQHGPHAIQWAHAQAELLRRDAITRPAADQTEDREPPDAHVPSPALGADGDQPGQRAGEQLVAVEEQRSRLAAQLAALPLPTLRQLDGTARDRARLEDQRHDLADRLQALPDPSRNLLGRVRDPNAAERARLSAALAAAQQQIATLDTHAQQLQRTLGPGAPTIHQQRAELERRIGELDHTTHQIRDDLTERAVTSAPQWAEDLFGRRPDQDRLAEHWDRGVREIAHYRIEHHLADDTPGLGPQPTSGETRRQWGRADNVLQQTQQRLGRELAHDRGPHHER